VPHGTPDRDEILSLPTASVIEARASAAHGTCESAMNASSAAGRSPPNELANFARSWNKNPPVGARIGDVGAPGVASAINVFTDSPLFGANAAM
jgi:hypothetical protein